MPLLATVGGGNVYVVSPFFLFAAFYALFWAVVVFWVLHVLCSTITDRIDQRCNRNTRAVKQKNAR